MFIKQLYTNCLSEAAYYIESSGEAAVIDPLRDIDEYLQLATERKATIKYIFETHFHADFVSGHIDLSKASGAPIIYGPNTETNFPIHLAKDGETFKLGAVTITAIHTPGHTLESTCYLLKDENGKPHALFSGDTLFVGDVGRPDLFSGSMTKEELASMMYDSLQTKIASLPDDVIVYPAHGPGSACGKNLGPSTYSTIASEKETNYALKPQSREEFIKAVTEGLSEPPQYFPINARINKEGYESLEHLIDNFKAMSVQEFKSIISDPEVIILDTRRSTDFTNGFVPGSISIGLEGRFAEWAGSLLSFDKDLYLVAEKGKEQESLVRLARVGFEKIKGYLEGGYEAWRDASESIDMIIEVDPDEMLMDLPFDKQMVVLDVRREPEFADGHVAGAVNLPLNDMNDPGTMANINETDNVYVHCASGYRSVIASSLLKKQGIHNIRNVTGGWSKIREQKNVEIVKEKSVLN
ncbi:MAG TPA: rhodanese-like domain-containing protein [Chitinophagaceae bacterium]|nr:rhodanese-like domain-containing protein [Chitinophagaceae bacterium]